MNELFTLFAVFISLFLFGMTVMRGGLLHLSEDRVRESVQLIVNTPFKGLMVGVIITAVLQSSSAVMVIAIGFVAAGYLSFRHSIGIILGTNIGTVITTELIAIDLSAAIIPMLIVGLVCLVMPFALSYSVGCVCLGLSCIFIAMEGLESLAYPLAAIPSVHSLISLTNEMTLIGIGLGTLLTAVIQSSTATNAIAMGFMNEHIISLPAGISLMLGANIGTCATAYLASIGAGHSARLVAFAHIWLNLLGVLLFIPLVSLLSHIVQVLATFPSVQLAHAGTIFNLVCSLLMLPFVSLFASMVERIHGRNIHL